MTSTGGPSAALPPVAVDIVGFDDLAMRLIEGIRGCPDLRLRAILEDDPERRERIATLGLPTGGAEAGDVQVVREGEQTVVVTPGAREVIQGADCLALRRVVAALEAAACPAERIYLLVLERSERVDCLTPRFGDANDAAVWIAGDGPSVVVQRVQVPYDRSNVHVLRIALRVAADRGDVLTALRATPHVLVERAADGLPHTAALQERRRDGGRPAGEGPEIVVWEESVAVQGRNLHMTVDVCPHATPVPETLQAIRSLGARRAGGAS